MAKKSEDAQKPEPTRTTIRDPETGQLVNSEAEFRQNQKKQDKPAAEAAEEKTK